MRNPLLVASIVLLATMMVNVPQGAGDTASSAVGHAEEIEQWFQWRLERLKAPGGYLSIVGLFWLESGDNTFGSDPSNDFVFPDKAPGTMGMFNVDDGEVTVIVDPRVEITHEGEAVQNLVLRDDHDEEGPTVLEWGTMSWFVIRRGEKLLIRLKDPESENRANFGVLVQYPVDDRWRVVGRVEYYTPTKYFETMNSVGIPAREWFYGAVVFELEGEKYRLDALHERGTEDWFIIFADETSGLETYPAGRYMYCKPPDENGNVVIDFNKSYNPPCAFSDYTTCLFAPPQNFLPIRVTAGEKSYKSGNED